RHTRCLSDWSSDVCSSDLTLRSRVARPPLLLRSVEHRPFVLDYAENDEMRVARPERLAEIVAVQGIPAAAWIADSIVPEVAAARSEERRVGKAWRWRWQPY